MIRDLILCLLIFLLALFCYLGYSKLGMEIEQLKWVNKMLGKVIQNYHKGFNMVGYDSELATSAQEKRLLKILTDNLPSYGITVTATDS